MVSSSTVFLLAELSLYRWARLCACRSYCVTLQLSLYLGCVCNFPSLISLFRWMCKCSKFLSCLFVSLSNTTSYQHNIQAAVYDCTASSHKSSTWSIQHPLTICRLAIFAEALWWSFIETRRWLTSRDAPSHGFARKRSGGKSWVDVDGVVVMASRMAKREAFHFGESFLSVAVLLLCATRWVILLAVGV